MSASRPTSDAADASFSPHEGRGAPAGPRRLVLFGILFYLLLAGVALLWRHLATRPATPLARPGHGFRDLLFGGLAAGLLLALWAIVRALVPLARTLEARLADLLGPLTLSQAWILALLSGCSEELFFRGAVQAAWGFWPATLLFALAHTGGGREMWLWSAFAGVAGALLGGLVVWSGSLLAAVLAHILVNVVQLARLGRVAAVTPRPPSPLLCLGALSATPRRL